MQVFVDKVGVSIFTPPPKKLGFLRSRFFIFQNVFKWSDIMFGGYFDLREHVYVILLILEHPHRHIRPTRKLEKYFCAQNAVFWPYLA